MLELSRKVGAKAVIDVRAGNDAAVAGIWKVIGIREVRDDDLRDAIIVLSMP